MRSKLFSRNQQNVPAPALKSSEKEMEVPIRLAAEYLFGVLKDDGMFEYRINTNPVVTLNRRYNILRHAGTIYALCSYLNKYPDDNQLSKTKLACRYLLDRAVGNVEDETDLKAVWSDPAVNGGNNPREAKLGGSGLGLVALMSINGIAPGFVDLKDAQALGRFIVFMQKPDGGFYSKYTPSKGGRCDDWVSLYYPGEAALGLLMLYEMDASDEWLNSAYRALAFLAESRKGSVDVPADHWALLATAKLLSLDVHPSVPVSRALLINHTEQICSAMLKEQVVGSRRSCLNGGFTLDGRTTPAATRLEGLLAARLILSKKLPVYPDIDEAIQRGISFLRNAQIKDEPYAGGIPCAVDRLKGWPWRIKNFNERSTEIRIDYVQHALSAMLEYQRIMQ